MEGVKGNKTTTTLHGEASNSAALPPQSEEEEVDKDMLCPICMQVMKDAFLTPCGHTFCYMCITTHLQTKNNCPCCSHSLTANRLYPNFLLNKLLVKACARRTAKSSSPSEQLRRALQQGCDMSVKELDSLLSLISEKKLKKEQEEAEMNLQILTYFMHCLRKKQMDELNQVQAELRYIKEDLRPVERRCIDLCRRRERYSAKLDVLDEDDTRPAIAEDQTRVQNGKAEERSIASTTHESENTTQSRLASARKTRVQDKFNKLQLSYLQRRRYWEINMMKSDSYGFSREGYTRGLAEFESALSTFTRYSRLRVVAELGHRDLFHSDGIVSSIEFDRDDEFFATAGVSQPIKIFEFSTVVNEPEKCPVVEMSTRSILSCLSWNKYMKHIIASSDYEGIVTIWDVNTQQSVTEYEEHEQRAWCVDFSHKDPFMLVSGSDDCKVKVWCTNRGESVLNIDMKATIYSVRYNPGSSVHVAVGCADHHTHYYDLRKPDQPLKVLRGHTKAVTQVKFLSNYELASSSIDSTLLLWDLDQNLRLRSFKEHTDYTNFVGLAANSEYMVCGSETNEVFVYGKAICMPAARYKFNYDEYEDDADFVSAVCLKRDSPTLVAANTRGVMKVLELAP